MALLTQKIEIPLGGGIDEKTQAELVGGNSLLSSSGLVHAKGGSLQKPLGLAGVAGGSLAPARAVAYKGEFLSIGGVPSGNVAGAALSTYSPTLATWRTPGGVPQHAFRRFPIVGLNAGLSPINWDVAYGGGYIIVAAALSDGSIWAWLIDAANGAIALRRQVTTVGTSPVVKVVAFNNGTTALLVASGSAAPTTLTGFHIDLTNPLAAGWVAFGTAITDRLSGSSVWDLCALDSTAVLVYANSSGTNNCLTARVLNNFGNSLASTTRNMSVTTLGAVGVAGVTGDQVWVVYQTFPQNNNVNVFTMDPSTLASTAGNTLFFGAAPIVPTSLGVVVVGTAQAVVAASFRQAAASGAATAQTIVGYAAMSGGAIAVTSPSVGPRLTMEVRPFLQNGRVFIGVAPVTGSDPLNVAANGANVGANLWIIDVTSTVSGAPTWPVPCSANVIPRLYSPVYQNPGVAPTPAHVAQISATKAAVLYRVLQAAISSGLEFATVDTTARDQWAPALYGDLMTIAGAAPYIYDGADVFEVSHVAPPEVWEVAATVAGNLTGTYAWTAVYEHIDGRSWVAVSQPATPIAGIAVTSKQVTVRVSNPGVTGRAGLRMVLYRTKAAGTVYYRVTSSETVTTSADHIDIVDNITDANLGAPLYSQPGILGTPLPKQAPPAALHAIRHLDRVMWLAHPRTIWPSFTIVPGEEPATNDALQIFVPSRLDCTALASMDGRLVVFSPEEIGLIDGQGPPENGGSGDEWTPVQWVPTDVGCIDWRSIVVTSMGTFFRSRRGIELLNRSSSVEDYFGRAVENELKAFPTITSALVNEVEGRVYFECVDVDAAPTAGICIVYDLVFKTWATLPRPAPVVGACLVGNDPTQPLVYSVVFPSRIVGGLYSAAQQSASSYKAIDGTFSGSTFETAWIKVAGVQGYQRLRYVQLLAKSLEAHDLRVSIAYDYDPTYVQSDTWTAATIASWAREQPLIRPSGQYAKTAAFRLKVEDLTPTGGGATTGQGPAYLSIAFEAGIKPKARRNPATAKA